MENLKLNFMDLDNVISNDVWKESLNENQKYLEHIIENLHELKNKNEAKEDIGWLNIDEWSNNQILNKITDRANYVQQTSDLFVLIGVGGSNQAARSVIDSLGVRKNGIEVVYAGNNLSSHYIQKILQYCENRSVHINVIAKNFETLEPGLSFRVFREFLYKKYGEEAKNRITVTGTKGSLLEELAIEYGYYFLDFPDNIGGRFTALSEVGLFPMAVAGLDIQSMITGAKQLQKELESSNIENIAFQYAVYRNELLKKGFAIEGLAFFEPQLYYFSKWWVQLFAESEGKEGKGIFPVSLNYTEDLHSVGQYVQEGQRFLFETFIHIQDKQQDLTIKKDMLNDRFDYLDNKSLNAVNDIAFQATLAAHSNDGIPCNRIILPELNEFYYGQLFYFFEFSVYVSGLILGVNPFNQPGVENYKQIMFKGLERSF
ncbi:glucose-6-phosphate isomerase [Neobacillus cucumis]|uniref:glucose-6-phosphate isomerase n=1 Tax=Neobacillus cucumis TaxID=1740721 RepID=UPI002E20EC3F|nr:glucose-6-phosphate isomerase [Neobacillus cucumis]